MGGRRLLKVASLSSRKDHLGPEVASTPGIAYLWRIIVDGDDGQHLFLEGGHIGGGTTTGGVCAEDASAMGVFNLLSLGSGSFTVLQTLTGNSVSGSFSWNVPLSAIGAHPGSVITAGVPPTDAPFGSTLGHGGCIFFSRSSDGGTYQGDDVSGAGDYNVPSKTVKAGIAKAGTPVGNVNLTANAVVKPDGSFIAKLKKPARGSYIVVAKACYGPQSCAVASKPLKIT